MAKRKNPMAKEVPVNPDTDLHAWLQANHLKTSHTAEEALVKYADALDALREAYSVLGQTWGTYECYSRIRQEIRRLEVALEFVKAEGVNRGYWGA